MKLKPMNQLPLCLASTATWRSEALTNLGVPHRCAAPNFEEPAYVSGPLEDHVMNLALGKANSLASPDEAVIGFDQMIQLGSQVFGKPGNFDAALAQLKELNGKQHRLVNGVALVYQGQKILAWDEAILTMRTLENAELERYLTLDEPYGCAGSYKIESLGASLFETVSVRDLQSILGMPGNLVINGLRQLGYSNLLA